MYVPPHLKKFQSMFQSGQNGGKALPPPFPVNKNEPTYRSNYKNKKEEFVDPKEEEEKRKEIQKKLEMEKKKVEVEKCRELLKELKQTGSRTLVIKQEEKEEEEKDMPFSKPNDFWYDIYNPEKYELYGEKDVSYDRLIWNHAISKQSMVKLLKEQGTIRFNPIEYYKNTIQNVEKMEEEMMDSINSILYKFLINYTKNKNIHSMTPEDFESMAGEMKKRIEQKNNNLSTKILGKFLADLEELKILVEKDENGPRKTELIQIFGFKYHQYVDFLNKFYTSMETSEKKSLLIKQCSNDKLLKSMKETVEKREEKESYPELQSISSMDKFMKKEAKTIGFVNDKYVQRYLEVHLLTVLYQNEIDKVKEKKDKRSERSIGLLEKRLAFYTEQKEELKKLIRFSIMPFQSLETKESIMEVQKEMNLYEYTSFKDRVICEKEKEIAEKNCRNDKQILETMKGYNFHKTNVGELANLIQSILLDENRIPYMLRLLEQFTQFIIKENPSEQIFLGFIETYLYIRNEVQKEELDEDVEEKWEKIKMTIEKYLKQKKKDIYEIQMRHLYEYLEPLSRFDEKKPRLDQWQKNVFEMIDQKKNVIVIAPTSSGKTVLSTYCSIISEKLLFVVPSAELARQVCGMIRNLVLEYKLKRNITLITEKDVYCDNDHTFDILVGTPAALEGFFVEKNMDTTVFDYVVFDEIHQLNQELVGAELERLVKWMTSDYCSEGKTRFLALSACVGNAEQLHGWWKQFVENIELVYCNRRFLQQQKYLWNGSLNKIHPLGVCSLEFLQKDGFIENNVVKADMAFTPDDLYDLYDKLRNIPGFDTKLHPQNFFKKMRLSLENCKEWEWSMKLELQKLSRSQTSEIQKILDFYQSHLEKEITTSSVEDLYKLLKNLQKNNMLPTILFRLDPSICQQKFTELVYYLKERESKVYPTYYEDLQYRQNTYLEYVEKEKRLENTELPSAEQLDEMNMTPQMYLEDKRRQLKEKELNYSIKSYTSRIEGHVEYTKNKMVELKEKERDFKKRVDLFREEKQKLLEEVEKISEETEKKWKIKKQLFEEELKNMKDYKEIYAKQLEYYQKELDKISLVEEINPVNIYKPHPDFTFLDEFITSEHIVEYRKQLMDYMKEEKREQDRIDKINRIQKENDEEKERAEFRRDTYISYDHPFVMGIERGVILYLNRLPTPFQRVAQSLIASTLKLAPVTFSDQSLAFGINYPIRSVILTGGYIHPIVAHQMIGRAGRRGVDPKGYTVYYDVDWRTIMKEKYLEVKGSHVLDPSVWIMPNLWINNNTGFSIIGSYHLRDYVDHTIDLAMRYETFFEEIYDMNQLFQNEFNNELATDEMVEKMKYDIYKNKKYGLQSVLIPYLLEEISRWKFNYNHLDSTNKYEILQCLTAFLNGDLQNDVYSEHFRGKTKVWKQFEKYFNKQSYEPKRFEEKVVESDIPFWIDIAELLGKLYELSTDWRIKKLIVVIYNEIKSKIKKYTF